MAKFITILSGLIQEAGRIKLDFKTQTLLDGFVNKIYKKKLSGVKTYTSLGHMPIVTSDGFPGQVEIVLDPELPYLGLLDQKVEDSTDPNDFVVLINPNKVTSRKYLYQTLFHEIMHATDPMFSTKQSEKLWSTYDPEIDEKYWAHPIEFRASSNEFLEGIVREFSIRKDRLKNKSNIVLLMKAADNILDYFSKGKKLNKLAFNIINEITDDEHLNNVMGKILKDIPLEYPDVIELMPERQNPPKYISIIELIKKYDPEIWKRFLTMLYKTIGEIKSSLRNYQQTI